MEFLKTYVEIIGNTAGVIVLVSLLMRSLVKLRWINLLGALIFCCYGLLVNAPAIVITNLGISIIDIWFLYKMSTVRDNFKLVVAELNSGYYNHFIKSNTDDIKLFFGDFTVAKSDSIYFVLSNGIVAGLLVGRIKNKNFHILIDYVLPEYRDFKLGKYFLEENLSFFKQMGIDNLYAKPFSDKYRNYLIQLNFLQSPEDTDLYYKKI